MYHNVATVCIVLRVIGTMDKCPVSQHVLIKDSTSVFCSVFITSCNNKGNNKGNNL